MLDLQCEFFFKFSTSALRDKKQSAMEDPVEEIKRFYFEKPPISRTYITIALLLSCLTTVDVVSARYLYYNFEHGVLDLQIWRLLTNVFYQGKLTFGLIFQLYFANFAISNVETQLFNRRTRADLTWLILYLFTSLTLTASLVNLYFIADGVVFALLYIWCKRRPFQIIEISLMFISSGLKLKSGYFPWIYIGFNVLMGESFIVFLAGLLFGHIYIFIKDIMLPKHKKDYLPTPEFLKKIFSQGIAQERLFNNQGVQQNQQNEQRE